MKSSAALLFTLAITTVCHASTILVGTQFDTSGGVFVGNQANVSNTSGEFSPYYANLSWAQAFTLAVPATATDLSVYVNDNNVPGSTFSLFLTNQLGPGATAANVLFSGTGPFGPGSNTVDFSLGSLSLGSGTYYVVMTSDTPVPVPASDASDCETIPEDGGISGCYFTGGWGNNGTSITTHGNLGPLYLQITGGAPDSPGAGIADFDLSSPGLGSTAFQLVGDVVVPEPGTTTLAIIGLVTCLVAKRRRSF